MRKILVYLLLVSSIFACVPIENKYTLILNKKDIIYTLPDPGFFDKLEIEYRVEIEAERYNERLRLDITVEMKDIFRSIVTSLDLSDRFENKEAASDWKKWMRYEKRAAKRDKELFSLLGEKLIPLLTVVFPNWEFYWDSPSLLRIEAEYPYLKRLEDVKKALIKMNSIVKLYIPGAKIPLSYEEAKPYQPFIIISKKKTVRTDTVKLTKKLLQKLTKYGYIKGLKKSDIQKISKIAKPSYIIFFRPKKCDLSYPFLIESPNVYGWVSVLNGYVVVFDKDCPDVEVVSNCLKRDMKK
ncbi:hypothetical protein [Nitrosophilus alvini]|uniref:hypothetical protein n=1 Tax=Nitrosophilus alvini TaxID=2714855 RepID=UPI00190A05A4|nr:hypothetical protein [Nitrosophilus alvini]